MKFGEFSGGVPEGFDGSSVLVEGDGESVNFLVCLHLKFVRERRE